MPIHRRTFLAASSGSLWALLGLDLGGCVARAAEAQVRRLRLARTICPYCAVGCGAIAVEDRGRPAQVEGDPDHPINAGALCAKGSAMLQVVENPRRVRRVHYRAPGASGWQVLDWEVALDRIARRLKRTRDATFQLHDAAGRRVGRTEAIGCLGGAALDNEACYLLAKFARALGIVYLEHQARLCHSPTVSALAPTLGRGAMTNHWTDLANASVILIIGANPAENHPVAFRWITEARERGARVICVDPRFTRTAAVADLYAPLRPGTDVALVGGLIHDALENGLIHREYVAAHTNAGFLVDDRAGFEHDRPGGPTNRPSGRAWRFLRDGQGRIRQDPSLEDPRCVLQRMRRHFARYTLDRVSAICGTPVDKLRQIATMFLATHRPSEAGTLLYAMGATQHSHGTQNIRSYTLLQLLLGNIGVPGGGINALRGASNVQGATDHGLMFDLLPGYLKCPVPAEKTLAEHLRAHASPAADSPGTGHEPRYDARLVSLLKAWWGEHATLENEFGYPWLPKPEGVCSYVPLFEAMARGQLQGLLVFGQNPAVSGPDAEDQRQALEKLDWLVTVDLFETETAAFWKRPGAAPADIATEVFLLPAAAWLEKAGSLTNSGRWVQWRPAVTDPPGDARSELWILDRLVRRLKRLYAADIAGSPSGPGLPAPGRPASDGRRGPANAAASGATLGPEAEPLLRLRWAYGDPPDPEAVAEEINGWPGDPSAASGLGRRQRLASPERLRADGTTAAGNWLYTGSITQAGNPMARRGRSEPADDPLGLFPGWAWSWPGNQRILYNRAGCDPAGRPWHPGRAAVHYDWQAGHWQGDVPDGPGPPRQTPDGRPVPSGTGPFPMLEEGRARLFLPELADGPVPAHCEPAESPVAHLTALRQIIPASPPDPAGPLGSPDQFPLVATTCRVAEHWLSGAVTRNCPWLVELAPGAFVELSRSLARQRGIRSGDEVVLRSARGQITLRALVTDRLRPLEVAGRLIEQVAVMWHFGYQGVATGPSGNVLTPRVRDPAAGVPEYKAFLCELEKLA